MASQPKVKPKDSLTVLKHKKNPVPPHSIHRELVKKKQHSLAKQMSTLGEK